MFRLAAASLMMLGLAILPAQAQGHHYVNPYYRDNGTYVQPHYQTNPDNNPYNNWSTQGNTNPFTGQPGTRNPYGNGYGRWHIGVADAQSGSPCRSLGDPL
jgi:hypothetical protein